MTPELDEVLGGPEVPSAPELGNGSGNAMSRHVQQQLVPQQAGQQEQQQQEQQQQQQEEQEEQRARLEEQDARDAAARAARAARRESQQQ